MTGLIRLFSLRSIWGETEVGDVKIIQNGDTPTPPPSLVPGMSKVERRESTRLSSGASKFLRAFRTGTKVEVGGKHLNFEGAHLRVSPNPKGPSEGHPNPRQHTPPRELQNPHRPKTKTEVRVPPERSLSFQNGGNCGSVTQKGSSPRGINGKTSRPQSFLIPPSGSQEFSKQNVSPSQAETPRGHFYENLEVIRANLKGLTESGNLGKRNHVNHGYVNVPSHRNARVSHSAPPTEKTGGKLKNMDASGKIQKIETSRKIQKIETGGKNSKMETGGKKYKVESSASIQNSVQEDDGGFEKRKLRRSVSEVPPERIQIQNVTRVSRQSMFGGSGSATSRNRNGFIGIQKLRREKSEREKTASATLPRGPPPCVPTRRPSFGTSRNGLLSQAPFVPTPSVALHPTRSTPNLLESKNSIGGKATTLSLHMPTPRSWSTDDQPPPERDATSLKSLRYGPGHEKFPSWPIPVNDSARVLPSVATSHGSGSSRTKSWTEETKYTKEKDTSYARPHMKSGRNQHLKDLILTTEGPDGAVVKPPVGYRDSAQAQERSQGTPPQRESVEDLDSFGKLNSTYAHSEGYHSFISSDSASSVSTTTFLDQLRRESELCSSSSKFSYSREFGEIYGQSSRDSVATVLIHSPTHHFSQETLQECTEEERWADELRQRSLTSPQLTCPKIPELPPPLPEKKDGGNYSQHLKKFPLSTYTRPGSLNLAGTGRNVAPPTTNQISPNIDTRPPPSVAERINELESQAHPGGVLRKVSSRTNVSEGGKRGAEPQQPSGAGQQGPDEMESGISDHFAYLDPEKRHRVAGNTLKAIQKQALLEYYERHAGKTSPSKETLTTPSPSANNQSGTETSSHLNVNLRLAAPIAEIQSPTPPGRPPKKPHLRNPQIGDQTEPVPPPPPPRPASRRLMSQQSTPTKSPPPPLPSKPITVPQQCLPLPSPELPPPPPHLLEVHEDSGDAPFPPPPTPTEVTLMSNNSTQLGAESVTSSFVEEETLTNEEALKVSESSTPLSPKSWEAYHNIRVPSTTLIFTSSELTTTTTTSIPTPRTFSRLQPPPFIRSVSVDQNSCRGPPPVAQVAPLRGVKCSQRTMSVGSETDGRRIKTSQIGEQTAKVSPLRESDELRHLNSSTSEASSQTDLGEGEKEKVDDTLLLIPSDSSYFTTSESKAKFLRQYVQDMDKETATECQDLRKQKDELVGRLSRKLEILRKEQESIGEEIRGNETLGETVIERARVITKRNEFDKLKLHVEEIGKITSLLLSLSGRLARAETALLTLSQNISNLPEKKTLERKRDRLREQLEEAELLKESIDRRAAQVAGFLKSYLSPEEFADYVHFTSMKAKLIIDGREIDDKIKLGEEQMLALEETQGKEPH